jgi:hypothetical protein
MLLDVKTERFVVGDLLLPTPDHRADLMANAIATGRMVDMADFIRDTAKWL